MKSQATKRTIVHFVLVLCVAGLVRADQTIQSVQQALKDQGFYYGNITGERSVETTAAVRRYQIRSGLQVTGEINSETLRSLNLSSSAARSPRDTARSAATHPGGPRPQDSLRPEQNGSQRSFGESDRATEMNRSFGPAPHAATPLRMSRRMVVAELQRQLMSRGYYRGWIDGRYGPRTASALRAFQLDAGIPPSGHLDTMTLDTLGVSDRNMAYLESAPSPHEGWVPVKKFKHGKWKVKWKKYHRHKGDEVREGKGEDWWHGRGDDD